MRKLSLDGTDVNRGDAANHVLGRPEEQPARVHAPLPRRRPPVTAKTILADIKYRRQEIEPAVLEHAALAQALDAIKGI
jgi:hypothetical protein